MKKIIVLLLLLGATGIASAADNMWQPVGGSTDWTIPSNWSLGHTPYAGTTEADVLNEQAKIAGVLGGAFPSIDAGDAVTAYRVFVGSSVYGELTINGGTLDTLGYMTAAYNATDVAVINILSGTVNIGINPSSNNGHFYMGRNGTTTLNMQGGLLNINRDLNVAQYAGANSTINLSGGTIMATTLKRTGNGHIDISGTGELVLRGGDDMTALQTWIDNGWLTINGADTDYSVISYDPDTLLTTVAVPEPATVCLLGIGALSLIRRKK
jgi:hypothetical protein